ncbi:MAG: hypothetical protein EOO46_25625 [Flavobacterium sp.]|nr:MAG: hypothetical protein EOO46_25625 [Flavobacterium sp.]
MNVIKIIIAKIANKELYDSAKNVFNGIKDLKARLSYCESYSTNKLTEGEIQELSHLFNNELSTLFSIRLKNVKEDTAHLLKDCTTHLYDLSNQVKEVNQDFYFAKANHKNQLLEKLKDFKTHWGKSVKEFLENSENSESAKQKKFNDIMASNEPKKHLHRYVKDNVQPVNEELQKESLDFIQTISKIANHIENSIEYFVGNVNAGGFASQITQYFANFFTKNNKIQAFDERIANSIF